MDRIWELWTDGAENIIAVPEELATSQIAILSSSKTHARAGTKDIPVPPIVAKPSSSAAVKTNRNTDDSSSDDSSDKVAQGFLRDRLRNKKPVNYASLAHPGSGTSSQKGTSRRSATKTSKPFSKTAVKLQIVSNIPERPHPVWERKGVFETRSTDPLEENTVTVVLGGGKKRKVLFFDPMVFAFHWFLVPD